MTDDVARGKSRLDVALEPKSDFDLVDVLAFFWRFKILLIFSLLSGVLAGTVLWFLTKGGEPWQFEAALQESIVFNSDLLEPASLGATSLVLSEFLKTPQGARAFFEGMEAAAKNKSLPVDALVNMQIRDEHLIKEIKASGDNHIEVIFQRPSGWTDEEIRVGLREGLNRTVDTYNSSTYELYSNMVVEIVKLRLEMAEVKLQILSHLKKNVGQNFNIKDSLFREKMLDLSNSASPDLVAFLLANTDISEDDRVKILAKYQTLLTQLDILNRDAIAVKNPKVKLAKFGSVGGLKTQPALKVSQSRDELKKWMKKAFVGGFISLVMGLAVALSIAFIHQNKQRLQMIFISQK